MAARRRKKPMGPLQAKVFAVFMLLGGSALLAFGAYRLYYGYASKKWPTTQGLVLLSHVKKGRGSKSNRTTYKAVVSYSYKVKNKTYEGSRVSFGDGASSNHKVACKLVDMFPKGKTIKVYYKPEDPENAVLVPGIHWIGFLLGGIGLILILVGFYTKADTSSPPKKNSTKKQS